MCFVTRFCKGPYFPDNVANVQIMHVNIAKKKYYGNFDRISGQKKDVFFCTHPEKRPDFEVYDLFMGDFMQKKHAKKHVNQV